MHTICIVSMGLSIRNHITLWAQVITAGRRILTRAAGGSTKNLNLGHLKAAEAAGEISALKCYPTGNQRWRNENPLSGALARRLCLQPHPSVTADAAGVTGQHDAGITDAHFCINKAFSAAIASGPYHDHGNSGSNTQID